MAMKTVVKNKLNKGNRQSTLSAAETLSRQFLFQPFQFLSHKQYADN